MRHRKRTNKFGRFADHRNALFINLSKSLILHRRITTTVTKAKALKGYFEPLLTFAKSGSVADRRRIAQDLVDRDLVKILCDEIAPAVKDRNGGYLRIVKIGARKGDNAPMALVEIIGARKEEAKEEKATAEKK